jgi:hypothetical protein
LTNTLIPNEPVGRITSHATTAAAKDFNVLVKGLQCCAMIDGVVCGVISE